MPDPETTVLWRPVGEAELDLIASTGYRRFPPRLPDQPIFYPVCNERYAAEIAERWNARDGRSGYVTRFAVRTDFLARYERHIVGAPHLEEYWVPAEELDDFNHAIVGEIEVTARYPRPRAPFEARVRSTFSIKDRGRFVAINITAGEVKLGDRVSAQLKDGSWRLLRVEGVEFVLRRDEREQLVEDVALKLPLRDSDEVLEGGLLRAATEDER